MTRPFFFSYPHIFQEEKPEAILLKIYCSQNEYDARDVYLVHDFIKNIFTGHYVFICCCYLLP